MTPELVVQVFAAFAVSTVRLSFPKRCHTPYATNNAITIVVQLTICHCQKSWPYKVTTGAWGEYGLALTLGLRIVHVRFGIPREGVRNG